MLDYDLLDFWFQKDGYNPSVKYHKPIHEALLRDSRDIEGHPQPNLVILAGGERSGKSYLSGKHAFGTLWANKLVWIVGERYQDCRFEFEYLIESASKAHLVSPKDISFPAEGPCIATFKTGCKVRTLSSQDITTLASESPDFIIMVEAGRQTYQAFRTLWARAHHVTSTFLVAGTFESTKGRWFPDLWKTCQGDNEFNGISFSLPSYANPEVYPEEDQDPKILAARKTLSEEEFAERFLGVPRPSIGVVFPEFRRSTHVTNRAEYDQGYPVFLWIDPGFNPSSYAVAFVQKKGDQICIFDEIYTQNLVNEDVVTLVKNHRVFPKITKVVIDVAANTHAGAGEPAVEAWRRGLKGREVAIRSKYVKVEHGIQRTHDKLRVNPLSGQPYMIWHPRVENGIWEFEEGYKYHVSRSSNLPSGGTPIDQNNHMAKAIAYGLIDEFGYSDGEKYVAMPSKRVGMSFDRNKRKDLVRR